MATEFNKEKLYEVRDRLLYLYVSGECFEMNDEELYQYLKEVVDENYGNYGRKHDLGTLAPEYEDDLELFEDLDYILDHECIL